MLFTIICYQQSFLCFLSKFFESFFITVTNSLNYIIDYNNRLYRLNRLRVLIPRTLAKSSTPKFREKGVSLVSSLTKKKYNFFSFANV